MRPMIFAAALVALSTPAAANDWEKFYTPLPGFAPLIPYQEKPEVVPSAGDFDQDLDSMWRRGFAPIGYTSFNTGNDKTKDAERFARKLKARYLMIQTKLTDSRTSSMPITTPTTSTTYSHGTASASGSGGYATGNYSGTSTTYGSQTTYIPITVSRFDKIAIYFGEAPKRAMGILYRELTPEEVSRLETRRALVIKSVRDGSPAYHADLLPGDIITHVNGLPSDVETYRSEAAHKAEVTVKFIRNGTARTMLVHIPAEWRAN